MSQTHSRGPTNPSVASCALPAALHHRLAQRSPCCPAWPARPAAEPPEEVAGFLVPRVRKVPQEAVALTGAINTTYIQYLTKPKAYSQILDRKSVV